MSGNTVLPQMVKMYCLKNCVTVFGMRIVVINTKGGVAKTTSSMFLAAALAAKGSVELWDADPQGSTAEWALRAAEDGDPLPFPVRSVTRSELADASASAEADFTIVDTGPADTRIMNAALSNASAAIIPTAPGGLDLARTWETEAQASKVVDSYVLVTRVDGRTRAAKEIQTVLQESGVGYFETMIPRREGIGQAFGSNPSRNFHGYDKVAEELLEVLNGREA